MFSRCVASVTGLAGLEPRLTRGHEQHLVQRQQFRRLFRGDEMAQVDRVERTAEYAYPHLTSHSHSSLPMRTVSPGATPAASSARIAPIRDR